MNSGDYVDLSFRALKLRAGLTVQTKGAQADAPRHEAQFLAAIEGKGVMLNHEGRTTLTAGETYVVSGFSGQYDFRFSATVIQNFDVPFAYALLAYPESVKARQVRRAARMKVALPAKIVQANVPEPVSVMVLDLSALGAMLHAPAALGAVGDSLGFSIIFPVEGETVRLQVPATICYTNKAQEGVNVGVSFKATTQEAKAMLFYLAQNSTT